MKKSVFITGAAGFIGFHLALYLAKRGDRVVGYDNFNDYYSPLLKEQRAKVLNSFGIPVIHGDICDSAHLEKELLKHETSHLVHLAAQAGVRYSLTNPESYVKANLEGFVAILELCRKHQIKLTYASSSSVYGRNTKVPFKVTDRTDHQASLYGVTKKCNELMADTYHHLYGISVTGLRYFTVYGPWGRPDMAYYSFSEAIFNNQPIQVYNNGLMRRDFTYIDDIVEGTAKAMDLESACEVFNLGNHKPVEILKFINILENEIGKKATLQFLPMQAGDVVETYADISHSKKLLGFIPKTNLEKGLSLFVAWLKDQKKI